MRFSLLILSIFFLYSCGSKGNNNTTTPDKTRTDQITEKTMTGLIGAQNWEFVSGFARKSTLDENKFLFQFHADNYDDLCTANISPDRTIQVFSKLEVGEVKFNNMINAVFLTLEGNELNFSVVTEGKFVIKEITNEYVKGLFVGDYDQDNKVSGTFTLKRCP